MQIPTVEKFLFCLSLETGAQIMGWSNGILAVVCLLSSAVLFGFTAINYQQFLNATVGDNKEILQLLEKAQYCKVEQMIQQSSCEEFTPNLFYSCRAGAFLACRVLRVFTLCEYSTDKKREKCLNPFINPSMTSSN